MHIGTTRMHVAVNVSARGATSDTGERTTHCLMVFVAVDTARKPVAVPEFVPVTPEEIALSDYARRVMAKRKEIEVERKRFLAAQPIGVIDSSSAWAQHKRRPRQGPAARLCEADAALLWIFPTFEPLSRIVTFDG